MNNPQKNGLDVFNRALENFVALNITHLRWKLEGSGFIRVKLTPYIIQLINVALLYANF